MFHNSLMFHNNEGVTSKNSYAQLSKGMSLEMRDEQMHNFCC